MEEKTLRIALAGNPNSGKTTLFNVLTGSNQFVGNWPGVTVEKKEGHLKGHKGVVVLDLPGIYSLSPYSPEEVIARGYLADERPDVILNVVDGTNIERNLYLTTQLQDLGIPLVVAINLMDAVERHGDSIDTEKLAKLLGCPVVCVSALKSTGIDEAVTTALLAAEQKKYMPRHIFSGLLEHTLAHIEEYALHDYPEEIQRYYAIKLFERDAPMREKLALPPERLAHIEEDITKAEAELDDSSEGAVISERYAFVERVVGACCKRTSGKRVSATDRIDSILTNRFLALPIFAALMFLVYYISVTTLGAFLTGWMRDTLFGAWLLPGARRILEGWHFASAAVSMLVDGALSGVASVLGFVPQLCVLFILLAFLEACGYMSRIAFMLDKLFRRFGLSGKSFIPILVGTGCGVPGILASRTIENESDRRMTIITTTFIPCGAKLPIIALIAGALFGGAWWVAPSAYFIGIAAILLSGIALKKTKAFSGQAAPFVMELPPYRLPTIINLLRSVWERVWSFIKKAGTVILLASLIIWLLSNLGFAGGRFTFVPVSKSLLARFGALLAVLFRPLGWGAWEPVVAALAGIVAKESIVSTLSVLTGGSGPFTPLSGFSFLLFNLLCVPCVAAIAAIRREMRSAKWTAFAIVYQCALAYAVALCVYQFGIWIAGDAFTLGTAAALLVAGFMLFMVVRKVGAR
ncbi:MAG: ferrous iron transport protein B [Clostridiales bacterium]|nr:ferrous iron transport protein B [Clostridiales bacterium]